MSWNSVLTFFSLIYFFFSEMLITFEIDFSDIRGRFHNHRTSLDYDAKDEKGEWLGKMYQ